MTIWREGLKLQLAWWSHNYISYSFKYFIFQNETILEKFQKLLGARTKCGHVGAGTQNLSSLMFDYTWYYDVNWNVCVYVF